MLKFILITLAIFLLVKPCQSQDSLHYKRGFQWKPMVGRNFSLHKLGTGAITDNLYSYTDNANSWQVLSLTYFFSKHWGTEINCQLGGSKETHSPNAYFSNNLSGKFNNYYLLDTYVDNTNANGEIKDNLPFSDFSTTNLGIIYRIEKDKFVFYPKLSVGLTFFSAYSAYAYLKEKNANNVLEVTYTTTGQTPRTSVAISASSTFGYRISKSLLLFLDVGTSVFKTKLAYTATTTDLYTGNTSTVNYDYGGSISNLSLGTGVIFEIPKITRFKKHHQTSSNL